jgi:xylulokinase
MLIGLDIGTTGVKGLIADLDGRVQATHTEEYPLLTPHPGWAEQEPEAWWDATRKVCQQILGKSGIAPKSILGIGLSGQMHGSVFLDDAGKPVRPCLLWCDGRTGQECRDIIEHFGQDRLNKLTCNTALAGFTLPKVLWLKKNEPENFKKTRQILLPKDYIRYRLTGKYAAEVSDAAGSLMFDVACRKWSSELLDELGIPTEWLPECFESSNVVSQITAEAAEATGLAADTPVVGGGADNTCGAIGTGVIREGQVLASLGTSGVVFSPSTQVRFDPKQRIHFFCHSVPGLWYLMGCMLSAGNSFRWFRDQLGQQEVEKAAKSGVDPYQLITEQAEQTPLGSEGLLFQPYLMGERSPHGDPDARGAFIGLTSRHTKGHLARAVIEGVTFGMADMLEIMRELGVPADSVRATGGGAKSPFWRQVLADILGASVETLESDEGPALGAALIAGVGVGRYRDFEEATERAVRTTGRIEPIEENRKKYREYFEVYRSLYPALKASFHQLSELARE